MKKTDCPDCMKLLDSFNDIPTTIERTRAVWATQECDGAHGLDSWVANPTGTTRVTWEETVDRVLDEYWEERERDE